MNPRLPKDFLYLSMSVANRETGNSRLFIAEFQGSVFSWNVRRTPNVGHSSEALGLCKQKKAGAAVWTSAHGTKTPFHRFQPSSISALTGRAIILFLISLANRLCRAVGPVGRSGSAGRAESGGTCGCGMPRGGQVIPSWKAFWHRR